MGGSEGGGTGHSGRTEEGLNPRIRLLEGLPGASEANIENTLHPFPTELFTALGDHGASIANTGFPGH